MTAAPRHGSWLMWTFAACLVGGLGLTVAAIALGLWFQVAAGVLLVVSMAIGLWNQLRQRRSQSRGEHA